MLAVVLGSQETHSDDRMLKLPKDKFTLFRMATEAVVAESCRDAENSGLSPEVPATAVMDCLRRIAWHNHCRCSRTFTSEDAAGWMQDEPALIDVWQQLSHSLSPPLLKILTLASDKEAGEYQFSHLSFQEFLFVEVRQRCLREHVVLISARRRRSNARATVNFRSILSGRHAHTSECS